MITKYKLFLERRSNEITKQGAIDIIKNNCKDFLKDKTPKIFRGIDHSNDTPDFLLVKPSDGLLRRSANAGNHYTLLIDNSPRWSSYPKRSRSIICTTSSEKALSYGECYCVIPFDNAKIGICPENDIWVSFEKIGIKRLESFTYDLDQLGVTDSDFSSMLSDFKKLEDKIVNGEIKMERSKISSLLLRTFSGNPYSYDFGEDTSDILVNYKNLENRPSLYEYIDELFDPIKNGFNLSSYKDMSKYLNTDLEVWTDSNSIMISSGIINEVLKELY